MPLKKLSLLPSLDVAAGQSVSIRQYLAAATARAWLVQHYGRFAAVSGLKGRAVDVHGLVRV